MHFFLELFFFILYSLIRRFFRKNSSFTTKRTVLFLEKNCSFFLRKYYLRKNSSIFKKNCSLTQKELFLKCERTVLFFKRTVLFSERTVPKIYEITNARANKIYDNYHKKNFGKIFS